MNDDSRFLFNHSFNTNNVLESELCSCIDADAVNNFHRSFSNYKPTPLIKLPHLADELGLGELWVKDESRRFGLNAFKALGASYAIHRFLEENPGDYTFATATDGNHGRAVAWASALYGHGAVVFMPSGSAPARIKAIADEGADVMVVEGDYDTAVQTCRERVQEEGWILIQDTSWEGYTEIPTLICAGYLTMFGEIEGVLHRPDEPGVDVVIMQVGVGSWASTGVCYYNSRYGGNRPKIVSVEPSEASCLFDSSEAGRRIKTLGTHNTIMAGLNCGTPSLISWEVLKSGVDLFLSIPDYYTKRAMRKFYYPAGDDPHIISGESGSAGLGTLMALLESPDLKQARKGLALGQDTRVLVFNTEGDTDPASFESIVKD
jgi:diaminopropionate ammonia-lyase